MKIAIIGAMDDEINLLLKDTKIILKERIGVQDFYLGFLYGRKVILASSGWGKVAASSTTSALIHRYRIDTILFFGVAGAIAKDINIGDIVIAKELIQHDLDPRPIYQRYQIPHLNISRIPSNSYLRKLAVHASKNFIRNNLKDDVKLDILRKFNIIKPRVHTGLIATGDQFISKDLSISQIRRQLPDVKCVEMEGASVAQVCYGLDKMPFLIVRIISDKANRKAGKDFPVFLSHVAHYFTRGIIRNIFLNL